MTPARDPKLSFYRREERGERRVERGERRERGERDFGPKVLIFH